MGREHLIYIIRHGQTELNNAHVLQGRSDCPLNENGIYSDFVNNPAPKGMEPLSKVVQRIGAFLEDIKELPGNILISTHAIAMV